MSIDITQIEELLKNFEGTGSKTVGLTGSRPELAETGCLPYGDSQGGWCTASRDGGWGRGANHYQVVVHDHLQED